MLTSHKQKIQTLVLRKGRKGWVLMLNTIKAFGKYFYRRKISNRKTLSQEDYQRKFITDRNECEIRATYEKAWSAKNFEIDNYWKRATYFWAFQVASFAGYFAVLGSDFYENNTEILYCVACIGFITALAWSLINKGSKSWQRNWENHVDMLEDKVTGPLYKITSVDRTYSVSKINEIVSHFITTVWVLLSSKYLIENISISPNTPTTINWIVLITTILVIYFAGAMFFGHGRGRFGKREVIFREQLD